MTRRLPAFYAHVVAANTANKTDSTTNYVRRVVNKELTASWLAGSRCEGDRSDVKHFEPWLLHDCNR